MDFRTIRVTFAKASLMVLLMAMIALWTTFAIAGVNEDLITAIEFGGDLPKVKQALAKGADVNFKFGFVGFTPLMSASQWGHQEIMRLLIAKGADVNAKSNYGGLTALINASGAGRREVVQLLLANGANINAKDDDGTTALMYASMHGHLEVLQLLLANGAEVNAKDKNGKTALMKAKRQDIKELLIKAGAK